MAFDRSGLYCSNPEAPPGSRIWTYQTLDALTVVRVVGYFNACIREFGLGDKIEGTTVTGAIKLPTAITSRWEAYINSLAAGAVDMTDGLALATTDTD